MSRDRVRRSICALLTLSFLSACASSSHVSHAPVASEDPATLVPFDPGSPRYLLALDPLSFKNGITTVDPNLPSHCHPYRGPVHIVQAALQQSVLSIKNFSLIDFGAGRSVPDLRYFKPETGERGPYLLRVKISEYNDRVERSESGLRQFDIKSDDSTLEALGKFGASLPGFWFNTLTGLPSSYEKQVQHGVVALDFELIDPMTSRVLVSIPSQGTFSSANLSVGSSSSGLHLEQQMQSALEAALRIAIAEGLRRLFEEVKKL